MQILLTDGYIRWDRVNAFLTVIPSAYKFMDIACVINGFSKHQLTGLLFQKKDGVFGNSEKSI